MCLRNIHLSNEELRELLAFIFDKMFGAYSSKNLSTGALTVIHIATKLLDNGQSAGRLSAKEVASYRKLAQILQEDQNQKTLVPAIKGPIDNNGYLSLCVENCTGIAKQQVCFLVHC